MVKSNASIHRFWPGLLLLAAAGLVARAPAAAAAPVFSDGTLAPPVFSPNGDLVQDFTTLSYTLLPDSAQVQVSLTPPDGGTTLAVLQPLATRGRGDHVLVFDGRADGAPLPDGPYRIVLFGVGSLGEGQETLTFDVTLDTEAPQFLSVDPVDPAGGVVRNGMELTLDACVSGSPDSLTADFSALDTRFDPAGVTIVPLDDTCYRIRYTLSEANDRIDAAGVEVRLTAVDAGGNRSEASIDYCLSNAPPTVTDAALLSEFSIFQNGDSVKVEVGFDSPALVLSVGGDFSALDSDFDPQQVFIQVLGNKRFRITYPISDANTRPDGEYPLVLFAQDPGCGRAVDSTLTVTLDNAGDFAAVIGDIHLDRPAFSPNGDGSGDDVGVSFTALEDTVLISINAVLAVPGVATPTQVNLMPRRPFPAGAHEFRWDGTIQGSGVEIAAVEDQTLQVVVFGVSTDLDRRRNKPLDLVLDRKAPDLLSFHSPAGSVANGDVVELDATFDAPGMDLTPDFSGLDSGFLPTSPNLAVVDSGNGTYGIFYAITSGNTMGDGAGLTVPLTAVDPAGNSAESRLIQVCLSNHPPTLIDASFTGSPGPFSNGTRIEFQAAFDAELTPLRVNANFGALDSGFEPGEGIGVDTGDGRTFSFSYRISSTNARGDATNLPITLTAEDGGCGKTIVTPFRVALDNEPGERPVLDSLPGVTRENRVELTGEAIGAVSVEVRRGTTPVDTFAVVSDLFSGEVTLVEGENRFAVVGIDEAGNRSTQSQSASIFFVGSSFVEVPGRFAPGDEFFIGLLEPAATVRIHIVNLEGIELRQLETGPGDLFHVPWDGRGSDGTLLSSGPYIAVFDVVTPGGGGDDRLHKAFVFSRRGRPEAP